MREIIFRGKRFKDGEWVEGVYVCDPQEKNEHQIYVTHTHPCGCCLIPYSVIPETVGQYTGLKDKNGKMIFEGDIFECYVDYDDSFGYTQTSSFLAVVVLDDKHFCWGMKVNDEIQDFSDWTWENSFLVGNIHDNPELLKGE